MRNRLQPFSSRLLTSLANNNFLQGKSQLLYHLKNRFQENYFSYVVSNAGWYPSYDIRVDDIKNPVTIFYKANVFQNSGVAWKDVKLSFSNATPWVAGDVPVLNPWFIDFYNPVPYHQEVIIRFQKKRGSKVMKEMVVTVE